MIRPSACGAKALLRALPGSQWPPRLTAATFLLLPTIMPAMGIT